MARPRGTGKPAGEKYVVKAFSCPPDLWADVEAYIPVKERSALLQACLRREVAKRKREEVARGESGEAAG